MLGYAMVFPLLPIYAVRLDADAFTIGLMVASFSVAQFAASPLWGRLSDRFGRCPALMVSLVGSATAFMKVPFGEERHERAPNNFGLPADDALDRAPKIADALGRGGLEGLDVVYVQTSGRWELCHRRRVVDRNLSFC